MNKLIVFLKKLIKSVLHRKRHVTGSSPAPKKAANEVEIFIDIVKQNTMLPRPRLVSLYRQAKYVEEIELPGAYVECGVWKGGAMGLMALINLKHGRTRRPMHLFDSFDDICAPDGTLDGDRAVSEAKYYAGENARTDGALQPMKGFYETMGGVGTLAENKRLLEEVISYDPAYISYHVGWFQDTLPRQRNEVDKIAILRLDGDWYSSIKICLENLYSKVVAGGFIIIDDYGYYEGCTKAVDEFRSSHGIKEYMHYVDDGCCYWMKGHPYGF